MVKKNDSTLMYRIAKRYYQDKLSQVEIARVEGISRSTVSRLLEKANDSGIVSVTVQVPKDPDVEETAERLRAVLSLERVIVVPVTATENSEKTEEQILRDVAYMAAAYLPALLNGCRMVGIGWGRSVYNTATQLSCVPPEEEKFFVPLVSNFSTRNRFLQTSSIVGRYAEAFRAKEYYLNVSSFIRNSGQRTKEEQANILQIQRYWDALDAAVFSMGMPQSVTERYLFDEIPADSFRNARYSSSASFEALGQIYFEDGSCCSLNADFEIIAFDLQRLKSVPNVICVSAGLSKMRPAINAARSGFIKTLILDHLTAESMLAALAE